MNQQARDWLRAELRTVGLFNEPVPSPPPPHDRLAERIIVAQVLDGTRCCAELGVEPTDFYNNVHAAAFAAAAAMEDMGRTVRGVEPHLPTIAATLGKQGFCVRDVAAELQVIRDATEWKFSLERDVAQVRDLARRRVVLERLHGVDALMRTSSSKAAVSEVVDQALHALLAIVAIVQV